MASDFSIPVCIIIFKRKDTLKKIFHQIRIIKPKKVYILADGPRNEEEKEEVYQARFEAERLIDWDCSIIKNYAEKNRGVYSNIGLGAKWVLEQEDSAIFLEDDNLPEITFFEYCKEMLERYKNNSQILWVCGTNYLGQFQPEDGTSYMFTKHMLPCGWATWSKKFLKYYDGEFELFKHPDIQKKIKSQYENSKLYKQQFISARYEIYKVENGGRYSSWDYQMAVSIRANGLYGIAPCYNQIQNIGVDRYSIHGGTSYDNVMTKRFCQIKTKPLEFPLKHPQIILPDAKFEKKTGKIILYPLSMRVKIEVIFIVKSLFGIPRFEKFTVENIRKFSRKRRGG